MQLWDSFSWLIFICLSPLFRKVRIDKLHERIKYFIKTWILILYIRTTTNTLTGYALKEEKYYNVTKVCFEKKGPQAKNYFYIPWLPTTNLLLKQKPVELQA